MPRNASRTTCGLFWGPRIRLKPGSTLSMSWPPTSRTKSMEPWFAVPKEELNAVAQIVGQHDFRDRCFDGHLGRWLVQR